MRRIAFAGLFASLAIVCVAAETPDVGESPTRTETAESYYLQVALPQGQTNRHDATVFAEAMQLELSKRFGSSQRVRVGQYSLGLMTAGLHYFDVRFPIYADENMDVESILAELREHPFQTRVQLKRQITVLETFTVDVP